METLKNTERWREMMNSLLPIRSDKDRLFWVDCVRAIAILSVIICHSVEGVYHLNLEFMTALSFRSRVFGFSTFVFGRLGVPFFLMMTGYLLLDRKYDDEKVIKFWKMNWGHLLICTEIWIVLYEIQSLALYGMPFSAGETIQRMLFLRGSRGIQMWYMPMILGMYLLIPIMSRGLSFIRPTFLCFPIFVYSVAIYGVSFINTIRGLLGKEYLSQLFGFGFSGGCYGLYLLMGYAISKGMLKKCKVGYVALIAGGAFIGAVVLQMVSYSHNYLYNVWYDDMFLFLCSIATFELFSRMRIKRESRVISMISSYSFPVYLVHGVLHYSISTYICNLECILPVKVIIFAFISYILSLVIALLISRIPRVGKYILYLK